MGLVVAVGAPLADDGRTHLVFEYTANLNGVCLTLVIASDADGNDR